MQRGRNGDLVWDVGVVNFTLTDDEDFIGLQIDAYGEQKSGMVPFEQHHQFGFESRALDPDPDGTGCTVLYYQQGNQRGAYLWNDPRVTERLPLLRKGESRMYSAYGSFVRFHEDGRINIWTTTTNTPEGQGVSFQIGPNGFEFRSPFGYLKFDVTGFHVRDRSGARLDLGGCAGLPAPLDAITSYATLSAGMVSVEGSAVSQGTDGGAANDAGVQALIAYLIQVAASLQALGASTPIPPPSLLLMENIGKVA